MANSVFDRSLLQKAVDWAAGKNPTASATSVNMQQQMAEVRAKLEEEHIIDALIDAQAEMEKNNVPSEHQSVSLTPSQFSQLLKTLGPRHLQPSGITRNVGKFGCVGNIHGVDVYVEDPAPETPPLAQEKLDELAGILTEAVMLLRAGAEKEAMQKLGECDHKCDVRVTPRRYKRELTAAEIAAKQTTMMYGKSMVQRMAALQKQTSMMDKHFADAMLYGQSMMQSAAKPAVLRATRKFGGK